MILLAKNQVGANPIWASDMPKRASSEATTRSQCNASSLPPAIASPWTTATTGSGYMAIECNISSIAEALPAMPLVSRSFRSTPAQNDLPIARMTVTRSSAEGSVVKSAWISASISAFSALRFSGRLRVTTRTAPSAWVSTRTNELAIPAKLLANHESPATRAAESPHHVRSGTDGATE